MLGLWVLLAVWVNPCFQALTCPVSSPFPGSGSVFLQPALLAPGLICCASQLVPLLCRPQSLPLGSKGVGLLKPQLSVSAFGCLLYWVRLS